MSHYKGEPRQELVKRAYSHQSSAYGYDNEVGDLHPTNSYPMEQHMTPQQRRQEERRRQAEAAAAADAGGNGSSAANAAAAAAAAGTGSSPWLNKETKKTSRWKTIAWATFGVLVLVLVGVLAWYFAVYKKNHTNSDSSKGGGNNGGTATGNTGKFFFLHLVAGAHHFLPLHKQNDVTK